MVYVIYLITNDKQNDQIVNSFNCRNDEIISYMDLFINKHFLQNVFFDISEELVNEIRDELSIEYKNLNKDIRKLYKDEMDNVGIIKINLIEALERKNITEMDSVFELDPFFSFILEEHLYNKTIVYNEEILNRCKHINTRKKLIVVGSYTLVTGLKELLKTKKIHKEIYFKHDFQTPIEYLIYEYKQLSKL